MVGVSVGVLVGGTTVFVGVSVGVLVGGTSVLVGVFVAVGVNVGHFFGFWPLGIQPAVGCGVFGLAACVDAGLFVPNMNTTPTSSTLTSAVSFPIAHSFILL